MLERSCIRLRSCLSAKLPRTESHYPIVSPGFIVISSTFTPRAFSSC